MKRILLCLALCTLSTSCASALFAQNTFKLVLMPDTQTYAQNYPETFLAQTRWAADHADEVAYVLHQGDITNNNVEKQWEVAAEAMWRLEGRVPFSLAHGNHDLGENGGCGDRSTLMNDYFPYARYAAQRGFGGTYEKDDIGNNWHTFEAGGKKWLIVTFEFGPRNKVLAWADGVVEKHPDHLVIVNTHAYMFSNDKRMTEGDRWLPQNYPIGKEATGDEAVNDGEMMWRKFVSKHPNMRFVFSGHVLNGGTGFLVSEGKHGNKVYQILANYQKGVKGLVGNEGYMRIMTFDPKNNRVGIKTYSPRLDQYLEEPNQEFVLEKVAF